MAVQRSGVRGAARCASVHFGRYDGGLYRVEIPDSWNGELVLYAHGFVTNAGAQGSNLRVGNDPIREHLIQGGFAWAASSYRCNGYVPGQGLLDTMALVDIFTKTNDGRAPQRTYLTGTSMGGHVTLLGMQEFPTSFAGGLAMCPAGPELFDFFGAISAAAEVVTGVQFTRDTMQEDVARMTERAGQAARLHRQGSPAREHRDPDQRRAAAVRDGRPRNPVHPEHEHEPGGTRRRQRRPAIAR